MVSKDERFEVRVFNNRTGQWLMLFRCPGKHQAKQFSKNYTKKLGKTSAVFDRSAPFKPNLLKMNK